MSVYLEKAMFAGSAGARYRVLDPPWEPLELELIEVREAPPAPRQERWSLVFRGPDLSLPQRTYRLQHPAIGAFELFLVPVGRDAHGSYYEAVFNRLVTA